MSRCRQAGCFRVRAVTIGLLYSCVALYGAFNTHSNVRAYESKVPMAMPTPKLRQQTRQRTHLSRYSQFPHDVKAHRASCNTCHKFPSQNWRKVRSAAEAFPDITEYPKHESCLACHKQQFFKGARPPICSICHTNPSPRNGVRHAFPNPREIFDTTSKGKSALSDFVITFSHDKHIEIVSRNADRKPSFVKTDWAVSRENVPTEENCSVCHQTYQPQDKSDDEFVTKPPPNSGDAFWLKKGTFKTAPTGHKTCFTCHSVDTGILPAPENCAACHALNRPDRPKDFDAKLAVEIGISDKTMLMSWRRRHSSGTFRHEWFSHAELSCSACHDVGTMNTADPTTTKVSLASCSVCHVTATADDGGALNFEIDSRNAKPNFQCVKCHITFGKLAIPESHLKAISAAK